MTQLLVL